MSLNELELTQFHKLSTPSNISCPVQTIRQFANPILCYTDSSKKDNKVYFVYSVDGKNLLESSPKFILHLRWWIKNYKQFSNSPITIGADIKSISLIYSRPYKLFLKIFPLMLSYSSRQLPSSTKAITKMTLRKRNADRKNQWGYYPL